MIVIEPADDAAWFNLLSVSLRRRQRS